MIERTLPYSTAPANSANSTDPTNPLDKSMSGELQLIAIGFTRLLGVRGAAPIELTLYDSTGKCIGGFTQDKGTSIHRKYDIECNGIYAKAETPFPLVIEFE